MKQSFKDNIMAEIEITVERLEKHLKACMYQHFTEQDSKEVDSPAPGRPFKVHRKNTGYKKPSWD